MVVPVSVHVASVAVAKRSSTDSSNAGAGWLKDTWAFLKDWWAVVIMVITVAIATILFTSHLAELRCVFLELDSVGGGPKEG